MTLQQDWQRNEQMARAILGDRRARRRVLAAMLAVALAQVALGLWVIGDWLSQGIWRFLLWWTVCAGMSLMTMLMALYDVLKVIQEEKRR